METRWHDEHFMTSHFLGGMARSFPPFIALEGHDYFLDFYNDVSPRGSPLAAHI